MNRMLSTVLALGRLCVIAGLGVILLSGCTHIREKDDLFAYKAPPEKLREIETLELKETKEEVKSTVTEVRDAAGVGEVKATVAEVRDAAGVSEMKSTVAEIRDAANLKDTPALETDIAGSISEPAKTDTVK